MNMNQNTMITCVAALFGATLVAVSAIAQGVDVAAPGATIRVGPDKGAGGGGIEVQAPGATLRTPADDPSTPAEESVIQAPATPKRYLIGIAGGDISPELRMHLGLDGVGVIVRDVTPGGAAATAGIQKHDVLLSADGAPLASIQDLASAVRAAGPEERPIAIELIRRGKTTTVDVTPVEQEMPPRAAPVDGGAGAFGEGGFGERRFGNGAFGAAPGGDQQFGFGGRQPFQFRMFGPGVAIGGMGNAQVQANGISVQLQSQNGQSVVKAQKGDQTWEFDARDQQAIAQLPPDVRQMVQSVTDGGGFGVNIDANEMIREVAPMLQGWFERRGQRGGNLQERMEAMEKELLDMQQRMLGRRGEPGGGAAPAAGAAPAFGGAGAGGAAPVFEPGDALQPAAPMEIEIPAAAE